MAPQMINTDAARLLVEKVRRDHSLEPRYRRRAQRLLPDLARPALVLERLQRTAREALVDLPRQDPAADLARVITASVFLRYHSRPEVREAFLAVEDFNAYVAGLADQPGFLRSALSDNEPLMPWERSWLAEWRAIAGLDGATLDRALELEKSPPFVVFVFRLSDCRAHGITVRRPCSLDSVLGPHLQWREGGPISGLAEYVDGDLPRAAVSELRWVA